MEIVRMGELREFGKPVKLSKQYAGDPITIEDTPPTGGMEFFKLNESCFVSTQVWLPQVTWLDLSRFGFDSGVFVKIGDRHYPCRLPYVGTLEDDPNEWDDLLKKLNEKELKLVNRQGLSFWGTEVAKTGFNQNWNNRMVRGGYAAVTRSQQPINFFEHNLGFRPVLDRLPPEPELSGILGQNVSIFSLYGTFVSGQLLSISDYDMVLRPIIAVPGSWSSWSRRDGNKIIIDRKKIKYVEKDR